MAFEVWKNDVQMAELIIAVVLTPLGIMAVALRFVATRRNPSRGIGLEDWMALVAVTFACLSNAAAISAVIRLNGRSTDSLVFSEPDDYSIVRKWDLVGMYGYYGHTTAFKFSVLALYYRIFGVCSINRINIYTLTVLQTILFIVFCILGGFTCDPFWRYFDKSIPGTCRDDAQGLLAGETPNSIIDFAIVGLAIYMIRPLQLDSASKIRLRVLFGLGSFVGVIGFIKIGIGYSQDTLYPYNIVAIWSSIQMFLGILCCCLPVFNAFAPNAGFWEHLASGVNKVRRRTLSQSLTSAPVERKDTDRLRASLSDQTTPDQDCVILGGSQMSTAVLATPPSLHNHECVIYYDYPPRQQSPLDAQCEVLVNQPLPVVGARVEALAYHAV